MVAIICPLLLVCASDESPHPSLHFWLETTQKKPDYINCRIDSSGSYYIYSTQKGELTGKISTNEAKTIFKELEEICVEIGQKLFVKKNTGFNQIIRPNSFEYTSPDKSRRWHWYDGEDPMPNKLTDFLKGVAGQLLEKRK